MESKEEIRLALTDLIVEANQLMNNTKYLITELDKVESAEDYKKFDELADKLTSGFKHIEVF